MNETDKRKVAMVTGILRPKLVGRVRSAHTAPSSDPLEVVEGQNVTVGDESTEWPGFVWCTNLEGKGGWVPEAYLDQATGAGVMRCDYSAAELSVAPGDVLILHRLESGWYWSSTSDGEVGWVPEEKVDILKEEGSTKSDAAG